MRRLPKGILVRPGGDVARTQNTRETRRAFPGCRTAGGQLLEREINPCSGHPEVVVRSRNDVPAEIVGPPDMRRDPNLETAAHLGHSLGVALVELPPHDSEWSSRVQDEVVTTSPAENAAAAAPYIRRDTRAADREA